MLPQYSIFISYRRSDSSDIVGRIYDKLTSHYGQDSVFKDIDSIPYGVDYREHIRHWVNQCQVMLVIIGLDWLETTTVEGQRRLDNPKDWVRLEIEMALERGIPIIPLLVNNARLHASSALPQSLQKLSYYNNAKARNDPDFHRDLEKLIQDLDIKLSFDVQQTINVKPKLEKIRINQKGREVSRFSIIKIDELKKRRSALFEDYKALSEQLSYTNNSVEKSKLDRQKNSLEQEIEEIEDELNALQE
ncbi:TIR domain-containing protein [Leptothoe sp. EHU-05/26/07-4]